jgi:hypothetical protein
VTIGKGLSGLQDVFNTLGGYLDTAYAALPSSKELAMARVLVANQSGTITALQNENDTLKAIAAKVDAITAERDQWKARAQEDDVIVTKLTAAVTAAQAEAAAQKKRADDAAESTMLARAGWIGCGIIAGIIMLGIGLYQDIKWLTMAGIGTAVGSFLGVLVFLALAWVAAHLWLVIGVTVLVLAAAGTLAWYAHEKGWLTSKEVDGAVAMLATAASDATATPLIREATAALRSIPVIAASWPTPPAAAPAPVLTTTVLPGGPYAAPASPTVTMGSVALTPPTPTGPGPLANIN